MEIRKRKQKESRGRWEMWWGEFLISLEIQKKRKTFQKTVKKIKK